MKGISGRRCLGIDYGEKRIGLSYGDELCVAVPLPAATQRTKKERLAHIGKIIEQRKITDLVVGYPLNMDGTAGFKAREADAFIELLEKRFCLPVHRVDERLSTHQARSDLKATGKKASRKSGEIDSRAATVILQDFFYQQEETPAI